MCVWCYSVRSEAATEPLDQAAAEPLDQEGDRGYEDPLIPLILRKRLSGPNGPDSGTWSRSVVPLILTTFLLILIPRYPLGGPFKWEIW